MEELSKKLKEAAKKDGFDEKEVDVILNQTNILTGKVIKDYLFEIAKFELEKTDPDKYKILCDELSKLKSFDYVGCEQIEFKGVDEISLNIQIRIIDKGTQRFDIIAPSDEAVKGVFYHVSKYMEMTNAHYQSIIVSNKKLHKMMAEFMPKIDFKSFAINTKDFTIAFHDDHPRRIAPHIFYTDKTGCPIDVESLKIKANST